MLRPGETDLPVVQAEVTVVAPVATMLGGDQPAEVAGEPVPAELARALAQGMGLLPSPPADELDGPRYGSPIGDSVLAAADEAWWAEVEARAARGDWPIEDPPPAEQQRVWEETARELAADPQWALQFGFVEDDDEPLPLPVCSAPEEASAPTAEPSWWAAADAAVDEAGAAQLALDRALNRARRAVDAAELADRADRDAWEESATARISAAPDALTALAHATAGRRAALADLLERTAGGGLADRPRIALTDALTGALLALTDAPGLKAAGTCGARACRTGRQVCDHDLSGRPGLGPPPECGTYRPGVALDRFLRARDRRCRQPGCRGRVPRGGELDHNVPYPDGPTAAHSMVGFCTGHHRGKHQAPGWRYDLSADAPSPSPLPPGWSPPPIRRHSESPVECLRQGVELPASVAPDRRPDHRPGQRPCAAGGDVGDQRDPAAGAGRLDGVGVVGRDPALPGAQRDRAARVQRRDLAGPLLAAGGEAAASSRRRWRRPARIVSTPSHPAARSQSVSRAHTSLARDGRSHGWRRTLWSWAQGGGRTGARLGRTSPLGHETGGQVVGVEEPALCGDVGRRRDAGVPGDVPDEVRLVVPAQVGGQPGPGHPVLDVDLLEQPAHAQHAGQRPGAQADHAGELAGRGARARSRGRPRGRRSTGRVRPPGPRPPLRSGRGRGRSRRARPAGRPPCGRAGSPASSRSASSCPQAPGRTPRRPEVDHPAAQRSRGRRRTPPGSRSAVVTTPTQSVRPVGSLVSGRSCGPMRNPVVARNGVPPAGVCRIGGPRTIPATVDPVGAIRSRAYGIWPRACQIDST